MKKLLKAFKKLPPEARMVLAVAGLGSPLCAFYFVRRMFPGVSRLVLILCIIGVVVAVLLIIWLISLLFTRGRKKRTNRMATELADESQAGPQPVDVSAAIKANNEKFFNATRDLKKNVGISVYDLPWYIVIGDSGCGKTKLVNEGGLTFSTGKPEGYQLGTLNYNWWFTEDAIFVDMAGRLCNPQDDGDRREWSAFLDTIAKGRRGFPINGALVCVSAEHLLQDPPEKHESDANIALERLRDLQTKLGVTFATYLVVTKCDKILGFMQFFDRAERDITVKNQIFGWSKPGDFGELYDPERFKGDFDGVYVRLNELRVRRMNDEAEEIDLGLAYSFPEEFRQLYDPLQTYMRTLFPFIRHPRAVKNLIFRGVYFTSATQEGELILKHLTERLGTEAAGQFAPLDDLYPNKRPHFIKDVLFRKVFPEHGLVFRNEGEVIRHKKLNKVLKVGTAVLAVVLLAAFWWSSSTFTGIIGDPRAHAAQAAESIDTVTPTAALRGADTIAGDTATLEENRMAASILSMGLGTDRPVTDLERIRAALVEKSVVQALTEVDSVLRSKRTLQQSGTPEAKAYLDALEQYLVWFGCRKEDEPPRHLTYDGFETLCGVLTGPDSIARSDGFADQTRWYFDSALKNKELWRNPAQLLASAGLDSASTISTALAHVYGHYRDFYATLGTDHADEDIREWMRLWSACLTATDSYEAMLRAAADVDRVETLEGLEEFKGSFLRQFDAFDNALNGLSWQGGGAGTFGLDIDSLSDLIWGQRKKWIDYQSQLSAAARQCNLEDSEVLEAIDVLRVGDSSTIKGLDWALWDSLGELGIVTASYDAAVYDDKELFDRNVSEVHESFSDILVYEKGDSETTNDEIRPTEHARTVRGVLLQLRDSLAGADFTVPEDLGGQTTSAWIDSLEQHLKAMEAEDEAIDVSALSAYWSPDALNVLYGRCRNLIRLGEGTRLLKTILTRLGQVQAPETWGFAALSPYEEWTELERSPYTISRPARADARERRFAEPEVTERPSPPSERVRRRPSERPSQRPSRGDRGIPARAAEPRETGLSRGVGQVPTCATHWFLNAHAKEWVDLLYFLDSMRGRFLPDAQSGELLNTQCAEELEKSARAYMAAYVQAWSTAYGQKEIKTLDRIRESGSNWEQLALQLESLTKRRRVTEEIIPALSSILQAIPFANHFPDGPGWDSWGAREWLEVFSWMEDAITERWDPAEHGYFAVSARLDIDEAELTGTPWEIISGSFAQAWQDLGEDIGANARMPSRFGPDVDWRGKRIRWGVAEKSREEYALGGERLTGQLVEFEHRAQELLSAYLTETLWGIQQHFLGDDNPFDGWPYLPGQDYARGALKTVDFDNFIGFLVEIHRARDAFEDTERGLPDDAPGLAGRQMFYRSCEEWFKFLGLKDEPTPTPEQLQLTVLSEDPLTQPFGKESVSDTCQHTARWLTLDLGLVLGRDATSSGAGVLRIACERQYKRFEGHSVTWPWDPKPGKMLTVSLQDPLPGVRDPGSKTLGTHSPLALCAYLHRYGVGHNQNKTWYVTHSFERESSEGAKQTVGDKLVFKLAQPLPEPVAKLTRVSVQTRGRGR